ncbi:MAG: EF-hand domain-containing protein [Candidatus Thalassarchaeaceae archaeon]|nr:EF-hand domain-containing protein [Candidatus Thalassarchaeaceae archaeon]
MDLPQDRDEIITLLSDFGRETYPTLVAILSIAAYSSFVFMFYRVLAKRDLVTLDLSKYADDFKGKLQKYLRSLLFVLQYLILIPLLISFWTLVLATILTLLSDGTDHSRNALIATSVVGAVRILSYWTEDLSRDVAKMLPFAVLGVFLVDSTSVQWSQFEDLLNNLPDLAEAFYTSLVLLVILETLLRMASSIRQQFARKPKAEGAFHEADTNGDGVISKEEFAAIQEEAPEATVEATEDPEETESQQPL